MTHHDFIIAGGGAAGLSLAYHLMLSPLRNRSILIIDKDDDDQLQRNWGFWTRQPTLFDDVAHHTWSQVEFVGDGGRQLMDLGDYHYTLMHGAHFYRFVLQQLAACPNVTFARGVIRNIEDGAETARVTVGEETHRGDWVFDSVVKPAELKGEITRHHLLHMHFKGWEIETPWLAFNPHAARLFDFRTPQRGAMRFFYLMPYSECHAFVEYTLFSANVLKQDEYEQALRDYVRSALGIRDYRVVSEENGVVPLTDYPFPRRAGSRVMTIGAKAGRIKPSTGYSFLRVQKDSAAIVQSLLCAGHPFGVPADVPFYRLCDSIMLDIMARHGEQIKPIFTALFKHNPIQRIFRFLDEATSPAENLALMASLPPRLFLQSLFRLKVLRRL
ncbi:MAG: lycopene cyclase family protein [Chloroflexi bacterium]|nr:lycopene cyclase family protein [Chloroflexota bacterium]